MVKKPVKLVFPLLLLAPLLVPFVMTWLGTAGHKYSHPGSLKKEQGEEKYENQMGRLRE